MLTGEIRSPIDSLWNDFWSSGLSKQLSVIEQITCLLFIKRLDDPTMLRIGSMSMMLHGVENANIVYRDSLAEEHNAPGSRKVSAR